MPVKLTLDIFSGRENPSVTLDDKAGRELLKRLSANPLRPVTKKTDPIPSVSGFRGLLIEQSDKPLNADLPSTLYYTHDMVYSGKLAAKTELGLESYLFDNIDQFKGLRGLPSRVEIERMIKRFEEKRVKYIENYHKWYYDIIEDYLFPRKPVCPCAPTPDLAAWNTDPVITGNNNCYNYGCNYRTDTFAQPGKATNHQYNDLSACNVSASNISAKQGAVSDGLIDVPRQNNKCISPGHLVALVNAPDSDYHWYRKGSNGRWSHKMGPTPASILDDSGNPITDPRTADRGDYVNFCSFMQVKHGFFKIK